MPQVKTVNKTNDMDTPQYASYNDISARDILRVQGLQEAWKQTMSYLNNEYPGAKDKPVQFEAIRKIKERYFDPI